MAENCVHEFVLRKDWRDKNDVINGCVTIFPDGYMNIKPGTCRKCGVHSHEIVRKLFLGSTWIGDAGKEVYNG